MWGESRKVKLFGVTLHDMPHDSFRHAVTPGRSSSANAPKESSAHDSRRHEPFVKGLLYPVRNRNGPNMTTLPSQVHNGPVVFASLEEVKGQFGEFSTTQTAAQQHGEKRSIALAFEGQGPWQLPEAARLLNRQPIPRSDTQFLRPLDTTYACSEFGAQQPSIGSRISELTHCAKSYVYGPRCQLASFEMNSVRVTTVLSKARRGSQQYQATNSSMECW